jgi:transcriptional regulator with XRE-family HTH domain
MRPFGLRLLRARLGWPVAEMARFVGCSVDELSQWESIGACAGAFYNKLCLLKEETEQSSERLQNTPSAEALSTEQNLVQVRFSSILESEETVRKASLTVQNKK